MTEVLFFFQLKSYFIYGGYEFDNNVYLCDLKVKLVVLFCVNEVDCFE